MDYMITNLKWEDFFIQEAVELEKKMLGYNLDSLSKSKIRLSLENKILDWNKYETWMLENFGCSSLKKNVDVSILENLTDNPKQAYDFYSNYDFWGEDLLPIFIWEDQLIVFGLQYNENLQQIENHVFILASPEVLTYFANIILNTEAPKDELDELEKEFSGAHNNIEGLEINIKAPTINFKDIKVEMTTQSTVKNIKPVAESKNPDEKNDIWEFMVERHEECSFEAKKQFGAYLVLKIEKNSTSVFKMDPDLKFENIDESVFKYNINENNPFNIVYKTGITESFNVSQLHSNFISSKYKYVCISALKRGEKIVGFLVGFKEKVLSEDDQELLESLATECAA